MLSICFYYSLIAFIRFPFKPLGSSMVVPDEVWNFLIRQHLQQLEGPMSDCVHSVNKLMVEAFEEVEKVKFIFLCSKTSISACLANIKGKKICERQFFLLSEHSNSSIFGMAYPTWDFFQAFAFHINKWAANLYSGVSLNSPKVDSPNYRLAEIFAFKQFFKIHIIAALKPRVGG